jgi:uncharacterized protein YegL
MKKDFTRIMIVLDRSGSMKSILESTISGYNDFVTDQSKIEGECRVSVRLFDNKHDVLYDNVDIKNVPLLDTNTFVPRATTALYDAIGMAITDLGKELYSLEESERPEKVMVVVITDGQENASMNWNIDKIKSSIEHQTDVYNWTFLFIGGGIDAKATADSLSIKKSLFFHNDSATTKRMFNKLSSDISAVRGMSSVDYMSYSCSISSERL